MGTTQHTKRIRRAAPRPEPEPVESPFMTLLEAARILDINRSTAYELVKKDEFPVRVVRVGSQWRVHRQALDDFVNGRESA